VDNIADSIARAVADIDQRTIDAIPFSSRVTNWDSKSIVEMFVIMSVRSWDAMIRIYGISDRLQLQLSEDPKSWKIVCTQAEERRDQRITLDELAKLYRRGVKFSAVISLAHTKVLRDRITDEIRSRIDRLPVGKQVLFWLDRMPEFSDDDFQKAIQPPPKIKTRPKTVWLSDPFQNVQPKDKKFEQQSLNTATTLDYYDRLQKAVSIQGFIDDPFSYVATLYPGPRHWDEVLPKIYKEQRQAGLEEFVPILDARMEDVRLEVFNAYRKTFREALSWSALKGEPIGEPDDSSEYQRKTRNATLEAVSKIHHVELDRETLSSNLEPALDIKKAKEIFSARLADLEKKTPRSTCAKIRPAIDVYLETGSIVKSSNESGLDKKTVRKYVIELNLAPVRPVRKPRRKPQ
jgi:hypothetical protein